MTRSGFGARTARQVLPRRAAGVLLLAGLAWGSPLVGQDSLRLSLAEARARAAERGAAVLLAEAAARGAGGRATQGLAAFLPRIEARSAYLRSTDPVAVFGFKLRQERFGAADFDPIALNNPSPTSDFETLLEVRQPIFQPEALWGYRAARQAASSAEADLRRAHAEIRHGVLAAYFGADLAAARVRALRQAEATAREHAERARAMAAEGLVTEADAQLATVRALDVESDRIAAEADERIVLDGLSRLLALPDGAHVILTDTLASPAGAQPLTDALVERAVASRSDVRAAEQKARAARSALSSARASFLPSAAIFGQYAWNDSGSWFGTEGDRWTAGVLVTWTPFDAGRSLGRLGEAAAGRDAAETRLADLKRAVAAEVRAAAWRWESARHRLEVAQSAVLQAEEALRVVRVRYENELIPVTELLDAETRRTEAGLRLVAIRYEAVLARSALELAAESEIADE